MVENDHGPSYPQGEIRLCQVRIRLVSCAAMEIPSLPVENKMLQFRNRKKGSSHPILLHHSQLTRTYLLQDNPLPFPLSIARSLVPVLQLLIIIHNQLGNIHAH